MQGCGLQSNVMWKEHLLTNAGIRVTVDRNVAGTHILTNEVMRVTVDCYVEGTITYQCRAACYSRPLCGRNTYLPMQGCVL